ncbi:hypothetical protein ACOI22_03395 [Glaciecola sp. 2405UD65-10]
MKQIIIDITGALGLIAFLYGVYLQYGHSITLMSGGGVVVLWALIKSKAK